MLSELPSWFDKLAGGLLLLLGAAAVVGAVRADRFNAWMRQHTRRNNPNPPEYVWLLRVQLACLGGLILWLAASLLSR